MRFTIQQNTLQGKRHENQDRMGYIYTRDSLLLVVCDGLGGHDNGEKAASWVLETMAHRFQFFAKPKIQDPQVFLEASILAAHGRILKMSITENMASSPRTTIVCALIQDGQMWVAHAGDSRCYLVRAGLLVHRTKDHSKLQHMVDTGKISPAEATLDHPERNRLINCLGAEVPPAIEHSGPYALMENDTTLLCSDGVWGVLQDAEVIGAIAHKDLAQSVPKLVANAHLTGGTYADDATALVVRWLEARPEAEGVDSTEVPNSSFESTIHLTLTEATDIRAMTDEEMDAQIDEIHKALKQLDIKAKSALRQKE
jgi:PPM family protein phosphatase